MTKKNIWITIKPKFDPIVKIDAMGTSMSVECPCGKVHEVREDIDGNWHWKIKQQIQSRRVR